eukprot:TRINITY_DN951_c0_g1_i13.p1 TRINITY_DN951_c0_g1~~TRINITY_DN951_c0_g1_i13.p1  ORF type:complete len:273 (+),score=42.17 TRINITY_DN951_c0_g1_i13:186-1004(+)
MRPLQGTMMGSAAGTLMLVVTVLAESARASCVVDAGNASWYGELSMTTKFGELGSAGFCLQSADNNLALLVTMKGDWGELKAWGATGNSTGEDYPMIKYDSGCNGILYNKGYIPVDVSSTSVVANVAVYGYYLDSLMSNLTTQEFDVTRGWPSKLTATFSSLQGQSMMLDLNRGDCRANKHSNGGGLSTGAVVAIVISVLAVVIGAGLGAWWWWRRRSASSGGAVNNDGLLGYSKNHDYQPTSAPNHGNLSGDMKNGPSGLVVPALPVSGDQ